MILRYLLVGRQTSFLNGSAPVENHWIPSYLRFEIDTYDVKFYIFSLPLCTIHNKKIVRPGAQSTHSLEISVKSPRDLDQRPHKHLKLSPPSEPEI